MFINKMKISNFRSFQQETELNFVRGLNLITGLNGIGKSTILALMTNSSEFSSTNPLEKPYLGEAFRGEFSDVILYDKKSDHYDIHSTDKAMAECYFEDRPLGFSENEYPSKHLYKSSLTTKKIKKISHKNLKLNDTLLEDIKAENDFLENQKNILVKQTTDKKMDRFRFLPTPRTVDGKSTRAKITWPTLYLGLSRVYPTGENDSAEVKKIPTDEFLEDLPLIHKHILDERFEDDDVLTNSIKGSDEKKSATGIETDKFGSLANSIGQTNLGQILLAVKSFERLKSQLGNQYFGGLLTIDEIDATLHPAAQNDLLSYLYDEAKKLDLQIVMTTHSLSLINFFTHLQTIKNDSDHLQIIQLDYMPSSDIVETVINPPMTRYTNVLTKRMGSLTPTLPKVKVLTEDDVARSFLNKLFEKYNAVVDNSHLNNLNLLDVSLGWENLLKLINSDYDYYQNIISIVDPDVGKNDINNRSSEYIEKFKFNLASGNLFSIPGTTSIEKIFYKFIFSDDSNEMFTQEYLRNLNINKHMLQEDLNDHSAEYQEKNKHDEFVFSYKKWYKSNILLVNYSFDFLFEINKEEYMSWMAKLNTSAERISKILKS